MGLAFASTNLKISFSLISGPCIPTGPVTLPRPGVITVQSSKCQTTEGGILLDKIQFVWNPGAACPFTPAPSHQFISGSGMIMSTSVKCKIENKSILRANDSGNCSGQWLNTSSGSPVPCSCSVIISDPGQTKVIGD